MLRRSRRGSYRPAERWVPDTVPCSCGKRIDVCFDGGIGGGSLNAYRSFVQRTGSRRHSKRKACGIGAKTGHRFVQKIGLRRLHSGSVISIIFNGFKQFTARKGGILIELHLKLDQIAGIDTRRNHIVCVITTYHRLRQWHTVVCNGNTVYRGRRLIKIIVGKDTPVVGYASCINPGVRRAARPYRYLLGKIAGRRNAGAAAVKSKPQLVRACRNAGIDDSRRCLCAFGIKTPCRNFLQRRGIQYWRSVNQKQLCRNLCYALHAADYFLKIEAGRPGQRQVDTAVRRRNRIVQPIQMYLQNAAGNVLRGKCNVRFLQDTVCLQRLWRIVRPYRVGAYIHRQSVRSRERNAFRRSVSRPYIDRLRRASRSRRCNAYFVGDRRCNRTGQHRRRRVSQPLFKHKTKAHRNAALFLAKVIAR